MRTRMVEERIGEDCGPIDWAYDFMQHAWSEHKGGINPECIPRMIEMLRQIENGDWLATTDGGSPKVGWKRVIAVRMYDGWPHWKPVPSFCVAGVLGAEWHPFYSLSGVEAAPSTSTPKGVD
jgi:hypothetical protein